MAQAKADKLEDLKSDLRFEEHMMEHEKVFEKFGLDFSKGLTTAQVAKQREIHGWNRMTPPKVVHWFLKFLQQFQNFFALLLLAGSALCFIAFAIDPLKDETNLYLGIVLFLVVFATATFQYLQEAKSEKIMAGFKDMIPKMSTVRRNGERSSVNAYEIVPGDVVELSDGDQIPADVVVISANEMKVDNSSLTGEQEEQIRTGKVKYDADGKAKYIEPLEADNIAFSTTIVKTGSCVAIAIGIADNTQMGQIAGLTTLTEKKASPISYEIKVFIHLISGVAIVLGLMFFIIGITLGTDPIQNVVFAIGIIVANVPEGLLATVTVSLSLTALRMSKKHVLVKQLESVETLGSTTVIASDKTGTLTQNRMTVQHCWFDKTIAATPAAKNFVDFRDSLANGQNRIGETYFNAECPTFKKLQMVTCLCNNATFNLDKATPKLTENEFKQKCMDPTFNMLAFDTLGDASESGLLKFVQGVSHVYDLRDQYPMVYEIKFNSTNKWQLSVHKQPDSDKLLLVLKGAPDRIWPTRCQYLCQDGKPEPITDDILANFDSAYNALGGLGERVLGFAYQELDESFNNWTKEDFKSEGMGDEFTCNFPMDNLVFAGLLSLMDPPREGVIEAVDVCKRARIKVFMVTGDHAITARAIAKQIGILDQELLDAKKADVITGDDIREWQLLDDVAKQAAWDRALSCEQLVFARVSPAHKLLIVENNQRLNQVVAVTGDGVNDAPALKKGDIGVAMNSGKDVSKEAADMILMDDNFASIVNGVEEGRLIFDNLKKSIAYTLSSNIPEIGPFLIFITVRLPLPLSTVLILCVDLGTDMIPAISLAYENKESDIMDRPPRDRTERLVNRRLITFAYLQIGVIQALAGFFTYMIVLNDYGYAPWTLPWVGLEWEKYSIMCTIGEDGMPEDCGYGCQDPKWKYEEEGFEYCTGGCKIPFNNGATYDTGSQTLQLSHDPFLEHTVNGFRGFDCPNVCERSCQWFTDNVEPLESSKWNEWCVSAEEYDMFKYYCAHSGDVDSKYEFTSETLGFSDRPEVSKAEAAQAPAGAFYYWGGKPQFYPNGGYQAEVLAYAQTAYFISIIVVQWADLLICKTRKLTIFEQGMSNGFMKFGIAFETILGIFLIYTPTWNMVFGTRPLHILHWFPGVPWSMAIFFYDETRKYIMRAHPKGWTERMTYW
eukprot:gene9461-11212_t